MVLTLTSRPTIRAESPARRGFTLIELIVVVAIISLIAVVALPSVNSYFQVSLETAAREMGATVKETYNSSVITGLVHRMAFDLKENKYWVEIGPPTALLDTKETQQK